MLVAVTKIAQIFQSSDSAPENVSSAIPVPRGEDREGFAVLAPGGVRKTENIQTKGLSFAYCG
ncbi:MAG: hypothetical protein DMG15_02380 [Acidobacteria bacterium]|nr:MAG: hypothetical protein DMG16_26330 [Acidobacteriota bacterium]PYS16391.1 MAG: hypothetical protein DMG15_02380 [Acidobacteriota bacterium]